MSDFHTAPSASCSSGAALAWLRSQAAVDWRALGLPDFEHWDPAIASVARLVGSSSAPMALMLGPRGLLLANEVAARLFGLQSHLINGRSVLEVLPETATFYAAMLKQVFAGQGLSFRQQPTRVMVDGTPQTHWFNLDFTPVTARDGTVQAVLGIACDVTPLVQRIRGLSDSEQRLRLALEGSGMVGIWTLAVAGRITTADAGVARIHDLPPDACAQGLALSEFLRAIHPDDVERVNSSLMAAMASGEPCRNRYRVVGEDGAVRWVITSAKPVRDEFGAVARLLGVVVEITDQMETASALAESRFQFQTLTEALPQIVWSCDADGRHDYFSARWSEFTGIAAQDITEDTWKYLVDPAHQAMVASVWAKALSTGEPYDLDYRFRHHSGEFRWLRVMALPIRDDGGRIVRWFGTSTDVHEAYLIAEERERFARELERIATEDQLTGVLTRRAFIAQATAQLPPDRATRRVMSLLMMDIDHFKSINDRHGHPAGDKVLAAVGPRIRQAVRQEDLVGRMGGEEFAVLLPQCSRRQALQLAERIRASLERHAVALDDGHKIAATVSIGVTSVASAVTLDQLIAAADQALYCAKSSGRNRVRFATHADS
jgi:diguanylate cyclase (GGDEF)-like protein/PAS domain S-box-containing protein